MIKKAIQRKHAFRPREGTQVAACIEVLRLQSMTVRQLAEAIGTPDRWNGIVSTLESAVKHGWVVRKKVGTSVGVYSIGPKAGAFAPKSKPRQQREREEAAEAEPLPVIGRRVVIPSVVPTREAIAAAAWFTTAEEGEAA